jgi:hypothetical protein
MADTRSKLIGIHSHASDLAISPFIDLDGGLFLHISKNRNANGLGLEFRGVHPMAEKTYIVKFRPPDLGGVQTVIASTVEIHLNN